jgi:hypothetical protein
VAKNFPYTDAVVVSLSCFADLIPTVALHQEEDLDAFHCADEASGIPSFGPSWENPSYDFLERYRPVTVIDLWPPGRSRLYNYM